MKRTQIHLPDITLEKLETIAQAQGITLAELIRFILWQYLGGPK